jgi:hypothetical protein
MLAFLHDPDSDDRNLSFFVLGLQSANLPILQPKKYEHDRHSPAGLLSAAPDRWIWLHGAWFRHAGKGPDAFTSILAVLFSGTR